MAFKDTLLPGKGTYSAPGLAHYHRGHLVSLGQEPSTQCSSGHLPLLGVTKVRVKSRARPVKSRAKILKSRGGGGPL